MILNGSIFCTNNKFFGIGTDDFMSEIGALKLNLSKKQHLSNKMNGLKSNFEKPKGIQLLAQETERD